MKRLLLLWGAVCLVLSACGQPQYPTGAMTEDARLTIVCGGQELVLDGVTLATLVTTELTYELTDETGAAHQDVSVVFDLVKYLEGEHLPVDGAATWIFQDRLGQVTYVPVEETRDSLYIGITSGAQNLDYPVSVIPNGQRDWQVWQLERVEFSPRAAETLRAEAEEAARRQQLEQAQAQLAGSRHIAVWGGVAGARGQSLGEFLPAYVAALPSGQVQAVLAEGEALTLAAETVLAAYPDQGLEGSYPLALTYEQQAVYLAGAGEFAEMLQCCGMIIAQTYTCYNQLGQSLVLSLEATGAAQLVVNDQGLLSLTWEDQRLDNIISVVAGEPIIDLDSL